MWIKSYIYPEKQYEGTWRVEPGSARFCFWAMYYCLSIPLWRAVSDGILDTIDWWQGAAVPLAFILSKAWIDSVEAEATRREQEVKRLNKGFE